MTFFINLAQQQGGWYLAVLGLAHGRDAAGAAGCLLLVAVHAAAARATRSEWALVGWATLLGLALESAGSGLGLLRYAEAGPLGPLPPWSIWALWANFATLLRFAVAPLVSRPLVAAVAGAVGGPLAFLWGARLGAVSFPSGEAAALAWLAAVWAFALPTLGWLARRHEGSPPGYRFLGGQRTKELVRRA